MQSIIHRLGFIAVLVTTVTAFDIHAADNKATLGTMANKAEATSNQQVSVTHHANNTVLTKAPVIDSKGLTAQNKLDVNIILDQLHLSATKGDWDNYFSLYHPEGVFIGTDASERWGMKQFEDYARKTDGWHYELQARYLLQIGDTIVFDEQLLSPKYGISRGTGALVHTTKGWKIAQYHLSFPIPNDKSAEITQLIKQ